MAKSFKIPLSQGKYAILSEEDYKRVSKYKWYYDKRRDLALRQKNRKTVLLSRFVMDAKKGDYIYYKNGNRLDNRRENLVLATRQQIGGNRKPNKNAKSKYKGVTWDERHKSFRATIVVDGQSIGLGYYKDEKEAAENYNRFAKMYFGDFARLNEIE